MNAMRSRCWGSMLAWTLNTKPVTFGSLGLRPALASAGCGRGGGASVASAVEQLARRRSSCSALPKKTGRQVAVAIGSRSNSGIAAAAPARASSRRASSSAGRACVVERRDRRARCSVTRRTCCRAFGQQQLVGEQVVARPRTSPPMPTGQLIGATSSASVVGDLVEQLERVAALAVDLVDEGDDRHVAQAADLEQLARLRSRCPWRRRSP